MHHLSKTYTFKPIYNFKKSDVILKPHCFQTERCFSTRSAPRLLTTVSWKIKNNKRREYKENSPQEEPAHCALKRSIHRSVRGRFDESKFAHYEVTWYVMRAQLLSTVAIRLRHDCINYWVVAFYREKQNWPPQNKNKNKNNTGVPLDQYCLPSCTHISGWESVVTDKSAQCVCTGVPA